MLFRFFYLRVNIIFHITTDKSVVIRARKKHRFHITMDAEKHRPHIVITKVYRNTVIKRAVITIVLTEGKYE